MDWVCFSIFSSNTNSDITFPAGATNDAGHMEFEADGMIACPNFSKRHDGLVLDGGYGKKWLTSRKIRYLQPHRKPKNGYTINPLTF